jgi:hypothetical protein
MSEENKQGNAADTKALEQVLADVGSAESYAKVNDWAKGWQPKDLVSPSPFTRTEEELDAAIATSLESPEVDAALANVAEEAIADEAQLDAALNEMLTSPTVRAMVENVAADATEDARITSIPVGDISATDQYIVDSKLAGVYSRIEALEKRVVVAFKHAGFKF